jgi:hypothetical protein
MMLVRGDDDDMESISFKAKGWKKHELEVEVIRRKALCENASID